MSDNEKPKVVFLTGGILSLADNADTDIDDGFVHLCQRSSRA